MKQFKVMILSLFALTLANCETEEKITQAPDIVKEQIGQIYELRTVKYPDQMKNVDPGAFRVLIADDDLLTGKIVCNDFTADVGWDSNNEIIIYKMDKEGARCNTPDPLIFDSKMKFSLTAKRLTLQNLNGDWIATFVRIKPDNEGLIVEQ